MNFASRSKGGKNSKRGKGARQRAEAEEQQRVKVAWKEYTAENGKKAYCNIVTGQAAWQIPIPFNIYQVIAGSMTRIVFYDSVRLNL